MAKHNTNKITKLHELTKKYNNCKEREYYIFNDQKNGEYDPNLVVVKSP